MNDQLIQLDSKYDGITKQLQDDQKQLRSDVTDMIGKVIAPALLKQIAGNAVAEAKHQTLLELSNKGQGN